MSGGPLWAAGRMAGRAVGSRRESDLGCGFSGVMMALGRSTHSAPDILRRSESGRRTAATDSNLSLLTFTTSWTYS